MRLLHVAALWLALVGVGCSSSTESREEGANIVDSVATGEVVVPHVEAGSEEEFLARFPNVASRNGNVLTITLTSGQPLRFENKDTQDENALFTYFNGVLQGTSFVLLQHALWEGSAVSLVHLGSGETVNLDAFPHFSPDAQWFFAASLDLVAGYNPNSLAIFRITPTGAEQVWKEESLDVSWGPDDVRWVDAQTLTFTRVSTQWDESGTPVETRTPHTLRLVNNAWEVH